MEIFEKAKGYLKVTIDLRRDLIIEARKSMDLGLSFIYQVITISGVIAGFGFSAINSVELKLFFAIGELILFSNICIGLFFIRNFWHKGYETSKTDIHRMHTISEKLIKGLENKNEDTAREGVIDLEKFAQSDVSTSSVFRVLPVAMIFLIGIAAISILYSISASPLELLVCSFLK